MVEEQRVRELELRMEVLAERLRGVEAAVADRTPREAAVADSAPRGTAAAEGLPHRSASPTLPDFAPPLPGGPAQPAPASGRGPFSAPRRPRLEDVLGGRSLEDLLGGRVLAWVGGLAVLIGIAFLFAVGVSRGWIGEVARILIAGTGSAALLALGVWLHERRGRTDAALASVATGISALFVTITVAAQVYGVVPAPVALGLALAVGGIATSLAIRWESRGIAALGILGGLVSPVLAGAPSDGGTMAILLIASASAAAVLLRQRWDWLSFGVFVVTVPQWAAYLAAGQSALAIVAVLAGFGLIGAAAAVGYELRVRAETLRTSSAFLLSLNAIAVAAGGWLALTTGGEDVAAKLWLAGLAAAHLGIGLRTTRATRTSHAFGLLALVIGAVLADVAFAAAIDGPARALGWAGAGVMFAALVRRLRSSAGDRAALPARANEEALTALGLGVHVALSLLHAITSDASPALLAGEGPLGLGGAISLAGVAAGCLVSARLAEAGRPELRVGLDIVGLAVVAYLTALTLDGPLLTLAWSVEAVALVKLGVRTGDDLATWGGLAHLGGALGHALILETPPSALVVGVDRPTAAVVALGVVVLAGVACGLVVRGSAQLRQALLGGAAVTALYLASVLVVTPFQPGNPAAEASLFDLDVRQQGQVLLSALWSLAGFAALVTGLRRDLRLVRLSALALLLVTIGKVFLFDLATLTSIYRVASFIGLGLFLLTAAFVWQRMRPRPLPDMRDVPEGIR